MDLHLEAAYTNLPNDPRPPVFYTNAHYAQGYTNNGQIMGGWIGPEAQSYQVWTNYWQTAQNKIQLGFRKQVVGGSYIGGGSLQDLYGSYAFRLHRDLTVNTGFQNERWKFPALANSPQSNTIVSIQFAYHPGSLGHLRKQ